jgi:hypothetical protein
VICVDGCLRGTPDVLEDYCGHFDLRESCRGGSVGMVQSLRSNVVHLLPSHGAKDLLARQLILQGIVILHSYGDDGGSRSHTQSQGSEKNRVSHGDARQGSSARAERLTRYSLAVSTTVLAKRRCRRSSRVTIIIFLLLYQERLRKGANLWQEELLELGARGSTCTDFVRARLSCSKTRFLRLFTDTIWDYVNHCHSTRSEVMSRGWEKGFDSCNMACTRIPNV